MEPGLVPTQGGVAVTLRGNNFGVLDPSTAKYVVYNDTQLDLPLANVTLGDRITFAVPPGIGENVTVRCRRRATRWSPTPCCWTTRRPRWTAWW